MNQSVKIETINFADHSCDLAIYFDANAPKNASVQNVTIIQETSATGRSTGLWNNGGDITIKRSTFITDFSGQYLPIRFDDGVQGTITGNDITGTHRSAILIRGKNTHANIKGNTVAGSGAKTNGWAENGIQVDQNASAKIIRNNIAGHWWDGESNFASTGLLLFGVSNASSS